VHTHFVSSETLERRLQVQLTGSEAATGGRSRRRQAAMLVAAIERGLPAEDAVALIGFDPAAGAKRILAALLARH
jgi:hypothetical protein